MEQSLVPQKDTAPEGPLQAELAPRSNRAPVRQLLLRDKRATAGLMILVVIVVATLLAPLISPYDPQSQDYEMLTPPSVTHVLGTDDLGRDLFTRILYGARISLFVGIVTVQSLW